MSGCLGWSHRYHDVGATEIDIRTALNDGAATRLACADWSMSPRVFIGLMNGQQPDGNPIQEGRVDAGRVVFQCDAQHRYLGSPFPLPGPGDADDRNIFVRMVDDSRIYRVRVHRGDVALLSGDGSVVPRGESAKSGLTLPVSKEGMESFNAAFRRQHEIFESARWAPAPDAKASIVQGGAARDAMKLRIELPAPSTTHADPAT